MKAPSISLAAWGNYRKHIYSGNNDYLKFPDYLGEAKKQHGILLHNSDIGTQFKGISYSAAPNTNSNQGLTRFHTSCPPFSRSGSTLAVLLPLQNVCAAAGTKINLHIYIITNVIINMNLPHRGGFDA